MSGPSFQSRPSQRRPSRIACSCLALERSASVSSMRKTKVPPWRRRYSLRMKGSGKSHRRGAPLDREQVRRAPKVLLHEHLDGGLRPATVLELAERVDYQELPHRDVDALARW